MLYINTFGVYMQEHMLVEDNRGLRKKVKRKGKKKVFLLKCEIFTYELFFLDILSLGLHSFSCISINCLTIICDVTNLKV